MFIIPAFTQQDFTFIIEINKSIQFAYLDLSHTNEVWKYPHKFIPMLSVLMIL
jgi:hypothetical protein